MLQLIMVNALKFQTHVFLQAKKKSKHVDTDQTPEFVGNLQYLRYKTLSTEALLYLVSYPSSSAGETSGTPSIS